MEKEPKLKTGGKDPKKEIVDADADENRFLAAIGYVWILCLVPLFLKRKSKFAQFHAKQGLILFVLEVVGPMVFWIPVIGWLLGLATLALAAMGIMSALSGKYWEMPFLGKYAKKINL